MPQSAIRYVEVPRPPSPGGISPFILCTPGILSLALGRAATFAAGGLLKAVGLRATAAA